VVDSTPERKQGGDKGRGEIEKEAGGVGIETVETGASEEDVAVGEQGDVRDGVAGGGAEVRAGKGSAGAAVEAGEEAGFGGRGSGLKRGRKRKAGAGSVAGDVGVAGGIDGDGASNVEVFAAPIGGTEKAAIGGGENGEEGITLKHGIWARAAIAGLGGVEGGEVFGLGEAGEIDGVVGAEGETKGDVEGGAAEAALEQELVGGAGLAEEGLGGDGADGVGVARGVDEGAGDELGREGIEAEGSTSGGVLELDEGRVEVALEGGTHGGAEFGEQGDGGGFKIGGDVG